MSDRFEAFLNAASRLGAALARSLAGLLARLWLRRARLVLAALLALGGYLLWSHPPFATVHRSEVLVRTNVLDGTARTRGTARRAPGRARRGPPG
jgi:hypothetical protein